MAPVSYTHLDVYKRQDKYRENSGCTKKYLGTLNLGLLSDCPKLFRYERKSILVRDGEFGFSFMHSADGQHSEVEKQSVLSTRLPND